MRRFEYLSDPLFLSACLLYALNRWVAKPHVHTPFLHGQFNDTLLVPCALPVVLWIHRRLGLRFHDDYPRPTEIGFHLVIWSVLFEGVGPRFMAVTGDPWDIVAYWTGGALAAVWWSWRRRPLTALVRT